MEMIPLKIRKNLSLFPDEIEIGLKLCEIKKRNFSAMVGEMLRDEYEKCKQKSKSNTK
jgi:hypothetical protein